MKDATATIGASGIDTDAIINAVEETVERKRKDGTYSAAGLNGEKPINPLEFKNDDEFLNLYIDSLRENAFVDISDFNIEESRPVLSRLFIGLKKGIWNLLKFYTYRLWSQQNEVNGMLLSAIEGIHERNQEKISKLEARIAELENKQ